jgi:oligosaccharyltransferase complex subunit delta (ribophorin II)
MSSRIKEPAPLPSTITLSETSVFKFAFTAVNTASGEGVVPRQAHLLFEDKKGQDVTLNVAVKSNGKASFQIVSRRT